MSKRVVKFHCYAPEAMENALKDIKNGSPVATAAKRHGVPRITLLYKSKGIIKKSRMGPNPILSQEEEEILVNWTKLLAKAGFPVTKEELINSVRHLLVKLNRTSPFQSGRKWCQSFLHRHPSVSIRASENLAAFRASLSPGDLQIWYQEVRRYLEGEDVLDALQDPTRVFNGDEIAMHLNPTGGKILTKRGEKRVYVNVKSDEKDCLTVMVTANAAGAMLPPFVVFKHEEIPGEISASIPSSWGVGHSENGWMTGPLFYEFVTSVFYPWLITNNITLPVLLFLDGHSSYKTLHASEFCAEKGIFMVALHSNATRLIQPMDVSVFRSLKGRWQEKVHSWRIENADSPILKKKNFVPILKDLLDDIPSTSIQNGFRKCGLVPWDPSVVLSGDFEPSSSSEDEISDDT